MAIVRRRTPPRSTAQSWETIVGFIDDVLLVTYPGQVGSDAIPCRSAVDVNRDSNGRQAVLMFEHGDGRRPILVGCLKDARSRRCRPSMSRRMARRLPSRRRSGSSCDAEKASITLTKAGKVILQGEYISQRSMGVVRIKGGCVEIN